LILRHQLATSFAILAVMTAEGPMPTSELAARRAMDRTTCSREVAPLVGAGLVEVGVGSDRRYRMLRTTSLGDQRLSEGRPTWEQVQGMVADAIGDADLHDLLTGLRRLLASSERLTRPAGIAGQPDSGYPEKENGHAQTDRIGSRLARWRHRSA
jgi:DNA-binding MarR family transcriptional regulator